MDQYGFSAPYLLTLGEWHVYPGVLLGGDAVISDSKCAPLGPGRWFHGPCVRAVSPRQLGAGCQVFGGIPHAQQLWIKMF